MSDHDEWLKSAGVPCPKCGRESLRIVYGICMKCYSEQADEFADKLGEKSERRAYRRAMSKGNISMAEMKQGDFRVEHLR